MEAVALLSRPTRRQLLLGPPSGAAAAILMTSGLLSRAGGKEFWAAKDPSSWTSEEKELLLGRSPWAQAGFARMEVESKLRAAAARTVKGGRGRLGDGVETPNPTRSGQTSIPLGEKPPPLPNTNPGEEVRFPVLARWETAKPVRMAAGPPLPELAGEFYVIRLRGLPLMPPPKETKPARKGAVPEVLPNPNEGMLQMVKEGSRLERRDKAAIRCTNLFSGSGDAWNQVLLLFPRKPEEAITLADKLVTLESWFAPFHLSVKFPLKDMLYKGELSL